MVLLTMTPAIVAAVQKYQEFGVEAKTAPPLASEPSMSSPAVGKPISHGQLLDISRSLLRLSTPADESTISFHLPDLLRGSQVYVEPAPQKTEPTSEYKELMARLRREEEAKSYARMLNPAPQPTNPFKRFTAPDSAAAWDLQSADAEADEIKFAEVNRQVALIINVLVSIIACSIAVWLLTKQWGGPARLALSMLCSVVVGVAEVAIYAGYIRKVGDAKAKEKSRPESKTVIDTWVIEGSRPPADALPMRDAPGVKTPLGHGARRRKRQN